MSHKSSWIHATSSSLGMLLMYCVIVTNAAPWYCCWHFSLCSIWVVIRGILNISQVHCRAKHVLCILNGGVHCFAIHVISDSIQRVWFLGTWHLWKQWRNWTVITKVYRIANIKIILEIKLLLVLIIIAIVLHYYARIIVALLFVMLWLLSFLKILALITNKISFEIFALIYNFWLLFLLFGTLFLTYRKLLEKVVDLCDVSRCSAISTWTHSLSEELIDVLLT